MTNTWNHVAQNFHNFLRKTLQREFTIFEKNIRKLNQTERNSARESAMKYMLGGSLSWEPVVNEDLRYSLCQSILPWREKYQSSLPIGSASSIKKQDCPELIRWMADLSKHRDQCAQREDIEYPKGCMKQHRLIPLGSLKMRHIMVTKTVLKEELLPLVNNIAQSKTRKDPNPSFESYFPGILKLKPCRGAVFADYFCTDGVSVSLRYMKPIDVSANSVLKKYKKDKGFVTVEGQDMQSENPPKKPLNGQRLIGIDPGRRDVVFGSVFGIKETVRLSTGQLCHESGRRWMKKVSDRIFSNVQIGNTSLSDAKAKLPTSKTSSLEQWEQFIASYIPLMQLTLNTWKRRVIRKTSFWCYGKRDKCLDRLCKKITGGERGTLVAFGGAAACSTGCGYAPVPQKRLRTFAQDPWSTYLSH